MADRSVVVCSWGAEAAGRGTEETLTLAAGLAQQLGAEFAWLVLGDLPENTVQLAATFGVTRLDHVGGPALSEFQPDLYIEALAQYSRSTTPRALIFSETFEARLAAPRLAARLNTGVVMNVIEATVAANGEIEVTASVYGGDLRAVYAIGDAGPCILAVVQGAVEPQGRAGAAAAPCVQEVAIDLTGVSERVEIVQRATAEGPRLEDARVIVAGGRGLGSAAGFELIERLASKLGGLPAASRAIVDDGWVTSALQVGLTGKVVKPELYVAAGISGASQHMAGCSAAKAIVGINRDPDAAIYRYARYGIVGDCNEVLSALLQLLQPAE